MLDLPSELCYESWAWVVARVVEWVRLLIFQRLCLSSGVRISYHPPLITNRNHPNEQAIPRCL